MKKFISVMSLLSVGCLIVQSAFAVNSTGNLQVVINGIPSTNGVIRIALYNSSTAYNNSRYSAVGAYKTAVANIHGSSATTNFTSLPYGDYGIKVFQDVDNSGTLKVSGMGAPQEPYGFSNNPSATWHMPSYNAIKFQISQPSNTQTITLQHAG